MPGPVQHLQQIGEYSISMICLSLRKDNVLNGWFILYLIFRRKKIGLYAGGQLLYLIFRLHKEA